MEEDTSLTLKDYASTTRNRQRIPEHVRAIGAETRNLNEPVRRLIINKVVLRNFKSYGGTTVIGPFHKRFTSIVGPNGSGKSNVIDAMLFVFGFRAKQMRFDKLSDLIHNSQAYLTLSKGKPLQSMEVAVHFCEIIDSDPDVDEYDIVPGSELVISREVQRDNTSKYRINGKNATQKDVSNSLKSFGMDLYNNRFLILQGEVEQIAQMKPKATRPEEEGLLEYLEDIIGTNQYLDAIREAQKNYEEIQDNHQERFNRARVAQKEVDDLMESKREADEYIAKEKRLLQAQEVLAHKEIESIVHKRDEYSEKLDELEKSFSSANAEMEALQAARAEDTKNIQKVDTELSSIKKIQKKLNDNLQKMVAKDEDLRKQLLREVKKVEEKTKSIKQAGTNKPKLEQEALDNLSRADKLMDKVPELQEQLDKAEHAVEELMEQLKPELEAANAELAKCESCLAPLQVAYDEAKKDISILNSSIKLLEDRKLEDESNINSINEMTQKLIESLKEHKTVLNRDETELEKHRVIFDDYGQKINEIEPVLKSKTQWCTQKRGEYESLKRDLDEMVGSNDQYKYIMGLSASGKIRGIHGRLGDLGSIAPEYENAFMAAAGGQVDVLVVDTPDVASQVFDELRKRNLGRCSALALSVLNNDLRRQMEAFDRNSADRLTDDVQYLVQLVQPSQPIYRVCFFSALRETLLAPNLEVATKVGYKHRRRVVTLEGELIEPDGRMSGGGIKARKGGGINTKGRSSSATGKPTIDPAQLELMSKEIDTATKEISQMKEDISQYTLRQNMIAKTIKELEYNIDLLKHTVHNEEVQLEELSGRMKQLEENKQTAESENQISKMKAKLMQMETNAAITAEKVKEHEKIVANAYEAVNNVGKGKLRVAKTRVAEIESKLSDTRQEVDKLRKDAAKGQADAAKCTRDIEKYTKEIEQHKAREKDLESQLNDLEDEAAAVSNEMNSVTAKVDELQKQLAEINKELTAKNKLIEEHDLMSLEMRHNIDDIKKQINSFQLKLGEREKYLKDVEKSLKRTIALIKTSEEAQAMVNETMKLTAPVMPKIKDKKKSENFKSVGNDKESDDSDEKETNDVNTSTEEEADTKKLDSGTSGKNDTTQFEKLDIDQLRHLVEKAKKELGNVPNLGVIDDFKLKAQEYNRKQQELKDVQERRDETKRTLDQLCFKRKSEFMHNFAIIAAKLKEMYQAITLGGDAELELVDSTDPFTEGILFSVRPAKKSWKQIQNLSGGEKTLSSLALVFALHHYKPNPVYFMDEIDAALDFRNVSIIAQNIRERTKDAQFIIISLRSQMFELCNQMVGIYKTADVTKSVCINPAAIDMRKRQLDTEMLPGV
ncbi:RecF/RecN/SMC (structural maintenance of chromosome) N terminal domain family protein [Babesia bovis T2Bo]|uniref:Structural maintenance of chromosomes protein n=1 Tax=Babesia bovis TaxID=5865 RepID=A7APV2_BABBO|nr:RecF/RecN/SMC (structural maintenance of chromosome) N terminal domain family protein [Babesia bovis T2Bo]EDO08586.1 RecF/RecN/SMC (structural maintenance of chromosome) N terminal domain family protein [Babesia bovis T2Bo]|eukprot:XP_001612154.1 SMC family, C-terminal domain containing protein [Babesia bovis T2Bo]